MYACETEYVYVCKTERVCVCLCLCARLCVCVCVCERGRGRERESEGERDWARCLLISVLRALRADPLSLLSHAITTPLRRHPSPVLSLSLSLAPSLSPTLFASLLFFLSLSLTLALLCLSLRHTHGLPSTLLPNGETFHFPHNVSLPTKNPASIKSNFHFFSFRICYTFLLFFFFCLSSHKP